MPFMHIGRDGGPLGHVLDSRVEPASGATDFFVGNHGRYVRLLHPAADYTQRRDCF
jgi:hypothetical protein